MALRGHPHPTPYATGNVDRFGDSMTEQMWFICQEFAGGDWANLWTTGDETDAQKRFNDELFFKGRHIRLLRVSLVNQVLTK